MYEKRKDDKIMFIKLDSVKKVKDFVSELEKNNAQLDLISGHREVDGRSLLGIFSLDLTKPIEVRILSGDDTVALQNILYQYEY